MRIMPAVLVKNKEEFIEQVTRLYPYYKHFQVDIADGKFVTHKTCSLEEIESAIANLELPKSMTFDFDLIVEDVLSHLKIIDKIGKLTNVGLIFVHNHDQANLRPQLGLAISPQVSVQVVKQRFDLGLIRAIQIMSVYPGAQGQAFIPLTVNKVRELRNAGFKGEIYMDGGINNQTIPQIMDKPYRPDVLCIGSYLTQAPNPAERAEILKKMIIR